MVRAIWPFPARAVLSFWYFFLSLAHFDIIFDIVPSCLLCVYYLGVLHALNIGKKGKQTFHVLFLWIKCLFHLYDFPLSRYLSPQLRMMMMVIKQMYELDPDIS